MIRGQRDARRGLTSPLVQGFVIAITGTLIIALGVSAGGLYDSEQEQAARAELRAVGNQLASAIAKADSIAMTGGNISMVSDHPERIAGSSYTASVRSGTACDTERFDGGTCLRLQTDEPRVTVFVPIQNESAFDLATPEPGRFVISPRTASTGAEVTTSPTATTPRIGITTDVARGESPIDSDLGNRPPVPIFEFDPDSPWVDQDITFDASGSFDPDGSIVEYRWDWDGDGGYEDRTSLPTITHDFPSGGLYEVDLQVVDNQGATTNLTQVISVSGLVYEGNLQQTSTGNLEFDVTNRLGQDIEITHVVVEPADDSIAEVDAPEEIYIDADIDDGDQDGSFDLYDGGRIVELDDDADISNGSTATVEINGFRDGSGNTVDMQGRLVTLGLRYRFNDHTNSSVRWTNSTQIRDVVGAATLSSYGLTSSGSDVDLAFTSPVKLDQSSITVDLGGDASGTLDGSDFDETSTGSGYRYETDSPIATSPGVYKANLTSAQSNGGQPIDGTPYRDTIAVSSGPYTWTARSDWDAAGTQSGVVHDDYGDRNADQLELGYRTTDAGGSGLVAYYPLDDDSSAPDASGTGNDGNINGNPSSALGIFGSDAYTLDGNDDYVQVPQDSSLEMSDNDEVTVSAWVKKETAQSGWVAMFQYSDESYNLQFRDGNIPRFTIYDSGWRSAENGGSVANDRWYHYVGVFDGNEVKLYVDGTLVDTNDTPDEIDPNAGYDAGLGENIEAPGRVLDGQIDEVRVYERALSGQEVQNLTDAATEGTLTTGWQSGPSIAGSDVGLRYDIDTSGSEEVKVRVYADYGSGPGVKKSDEITLSGSSGQVDVSGLPGGQSADRYRLEVTLESSDVTGSPTVNELSVVDTS